MSGEAGTRAGTSAHVDRWTVMKSTRNDRYIVDLGTMLAAVGLGLFALALYDFGGYWQFLTSLWNR